MKIRMRGCRGSTPVPGAETIRYGGNTSCIQVTTAAGDEILLDAGTGIREAGLDLLRSGPVRCSVLISHTHWDHIQGLPFFVPLFVPGCKVDFYGGFDPVYRKSLQELLANQMQYCYFPVRENELKAELRYTTLRERETIQIGSATVTNLVLNHPVLNYGYRIEADGRCLFFTGDFEPPTNIYDPDDEDYEDYQEIIDAQRAELLGFLDGVHTLIIDAQYTEEEYLQKKGWGHGTYDSGLRLARDAGVERVLMTHHDPTRTDSELDAIQAGLLAAHQDHPMQIVMAYEGLEIEI